MGWDAVEYGWMRPIEQTQNQVRDAVRSGAEMPWRNGFGMLWSLGGSEHFKKNEFGKNAVESWVGML